MVLKGIVLKSRFFFVLFVIEDSCIKVNEPKGSCSERECMSLKWNLMNTFLSQMLFQDVADNISLLRHLFISWESFPITTDIEIIWPTKLNFN